jgi:hypothetical protein
MFYQNPDAEPFPDFEAFKVAPVVTRRYQGVALSVILKELVRDYMGPHDLSIGRVDLGDTLLAVDWQDRSLALCLSDIAARLRMAWAVDKDRRVHLIAAPQSVRQQAQPYAAWSTTTSTSTNTATAQPFTFTLRF